MPAAHDLPRMRADTRVTTVDNVTDWIGSVGDRLLRPSTDTLPGPYGRFMSAL